MTNLVRINLKHRTNDSTFKKKIEIFFFLPLQAMRKRDLQSFSLKLADLKEYEAVQKERIEAKRLAKAQEGCSSATLTSDPPLAKYGPKSKQEIEKRIGMST